MSEGYYILKFLGICPYCKSNIIIDGKAGCSFCLNSRNEKYKTKVKNNICVKCGELKQVNKILCGKCSEERNNYNKKRLRNIKIVIFKAYGNKCNCCGESNPKFLTIDHVNNDGGKFRKSNLSFLKVNYNYYNWIIKNNFPSDLQLLCFNCNQGKAFNNGVCPHKELQL
jgi:hypothetical protein